MVVLVDNFDSFTFNLRHLLAVGGADVRVFRNNAVTVDEIRQLDPLAVVLSPGPGRPEDSGICPELVRRLGHEVPVLGVCLGHQCLAAVSGAQVVHAPVPVHGKTSVIHHHGTGLFANLPQRFEVCRYHSLLVEAPSLPACWRVAARTDEGLIMALEHRHLPQYGVQFHPEAVLSRHGAAMMRNFLHLAGTWRDQHGRGKDGATAA